LYSWREALVIYHTCWRPCKGDISTT
jgi:hypothetical protein